MTGVTRADRPGPALVGVPYGMQATPIPLDSVQYTDWNTAKLVSLQSIQAVRTPTNTVRVDARFVSCADRDVLLRVRTRFLGDSQLSAEPESVWKIVRVPPHLTGEYSELSTSRDVANYLVEIAPHRDGGG